MKPSYVIYYISLDRVFLMHNPNHALIVIRTTTHFSLAPVNNFYLCFTQSSQTAHRAMLPLRTKAGLPDWAKHPREVLIGARGRSLACARSCVGKHWVG